MKKFLLSLLIFISIIGYSKDRKPKIGFSIRFASCFKNDTVTLIINKNILIDNKIALSDFSSGITDISIYQDNKELHIKSNGQETIKNCIDISNGLDIIINVNGKILSEKINLKRGRIIFIDNCFVKISDDSTCKKLTLQYFKKRPILY